MSGLLWPWSEPTFYLCLILCVLAGMVLRWMKDRGR